MLSCLIYSALTLILPLRLTYHALKAPTDALQSRLWSTYWAIFSILHLLRSYVGLLS